MSSSALGHHSRVLNLCLLSSLLAADTLKCYEEGILELHSFLGEPRPGAFLRNLTTFFSVIKGFLPSAHLSNRPFMQLRKLCCKVQFFPKVLCVLSLLYSLGIHSFHYPLYVAESQSYTSGSHFSPNSKHPFPILCLTPQPRCSANSSYPT